MHLNILLSICYGAAESAPGRQDSFAEKLARAFAEKGISTNIMASNEPVKRFGGDAIRQNKIQFNENTGMAAQHLHLFSTQVSEPTSRPAITITRPNKVIELSAQGLNFSSPKPPREAVLDRMATVLAFMKLPDDMHYNISPFLNRQGAEAQLANDRNTDFIIRNASIEGYLSLSYRTHDNKYAHKLLKIDELYSPNPLGIRIYELNSRNAGSTPTATNDLLMTFIRENISPTINNANRITPESLKFSPPAPEPKPFTLQENINTPPHSTPMPAKPAALTTTISATPTPTMAAPPLQSAMVQRNPIHLLEPHNLSSIKTAITNRWSLSPITQEGIIASQTINKKNHIFFIKPNRYETHDANRTTFEAMLTAFKATHPDKTPQITIENPIAIPLIRTAMQKIYPGVEPNIIFKDINREKNQAPEIEEPKPKGPGR